MDTTKRIEKLTPAVLREPCWETRSLAERLLAATVGEIITYAELTELAGGRDVYKGARHLLDAARRLARKEGMAFRPVPKEGLVRLSDTEIVQRADSKRRNLYRTATAAKETLACAQVSKLDANLQQRSMAYMGLFAAVTLATQFQTMSRLTRLVNTQTTPEQAIGKVFEIFASPKPAERPVIEAAS